MIPFDIENLILRFQESIIVKPHPTASIIHKRRFRWETIEFDDTKLVTIGNLRYTVAYCMACGEPFWALQRNMKRCDC